MKPDTLRVFMEMSIEELKGELKQIADAHDLDILGADICREVATNCQNIIDVAAALQNLYLTAADELDKINTTAENMKNPLNGDVINCEIATHPWGEIPVEGAAAKGATRNIMVVPRKEHEEMHRLDRRTKKEESE